MPPLNERQAVQQLGEAIGYGRVMQLCEELWRERSPGAEYTIGPCAAFMVPCCHPVHDENGHCEVCCGADRVTRWVAGRSRGG